MKNSPVRIHFTRIAKGMIFKELKDDVITMVMNKCAKQCSHDTCGGDVSFMTGPTSLITVVCCTP